MNDREFYLLVREYFDAKRIQDAVTGSWIYNNEARIKELENKIKKALEAFTEKEQQELPFKD